MVALLAFVFLFQTLELIIFPVTCLVLLVCVILGLVVRHLRDKFKPKQEENSEIDENEATKHCDNKNSANDE